jgi:acetate kinase
VAIDLFTYRIAAEAGAMVSALGGLEGLVFTADIGEHASSIRAAVCARLAWLGLSLDDAANDVILPASARRAAASKSASSPPMRRP